MSDKKFSFEVIDNRTNPDFASNTFSVVKFKGYDAISRPYIFEILLISTRADIDLSAAVHLDARLTFHHATDNTKDIWYNGVLSQIEQLHKFGQHVFYRALLVPRLWRLTLNKQYKVYLDKTAIQIIQAAFADSPLGTTDYDITTIATQILLDEEDISDDDSDIKPLQKHPVYDYVCQYGESHLNFISRWAEREGIFYYFTQGTQELKIDKVIFANKTSSLPFLPQDDTLTYDGPSETIRSFTCRQKMLPASVLMKNYNYGMPVYGVDGAGTGYELTEIKPYMISRSETVDTGAHGEVYLYGENIQTEKEGIRLAGIRKEEIQCREEQYFGESDLFFLKPGYKFKMADHYRPDFNWSTGNQQEYLIEEVTHEGSQTGYLISGLGYDIGEAENEIYVNRFTSLSAGVEYRPERKSKKPRITGTINANIDSAGTGDYAELDGHGRYKVRFPFDKDTTHADGSASAFVRMMQPHGGKPVTGKDNHGIHFPLRKGTEVLLSFIDGDPDRPVIAGAVPNTESASPVIDTNLKKSIIRDRSGNEIIFDSTEGAESISIQSPYDGSGVIYGKGEEGEGRFEWSGTNKCELAAGNVFEGFFGNAGEIKVGTSTEVFLGMSNEFGFAGKHEALIGYSAEYHWGPKFEYHSGHSIEKSSKDCDSIAAENNILSAGETLNLCGGIFEKKSIKISVDPAPEKFIEKIVATDNTSIVVLDKNALTMSFGKNFNPDKTKKYKFMKGALVALPIITAVLAAILAAISLAIIEARENTKKSLGMNIGFGASATTVLVIEGLLIAAQIITMMILGYYGLEDSIVPVSHTDEDNDEPDAIIRLEDDGMFFVIKPKIKNEGTALAPDIVLKKDESQSIIDMPKTGEITIRSTATKDEDKKITLAIGKSGSETATIKMINKKITLAIGKSGSETATIEMEDKGMTLKCGKAKIWLNPDTGNINIDTDKELKLTCNEKMLIQSKKDIRMNSTTKVNINKMSVDDQEVKVLQGRFSHKYLTVG